MEGWIIMFNNLMVKLINKHFAWQVKEQQKMVNNLNNTVERYTNCIIKIKDDINKHRDKISGLSGVLYDINKSIGKAKTLQDNFSKIFKD